MNYLVVLFKHKILWIVLLCCINILTIYSNKWFSLFYIFLFILFVIKNVPRVVILVYLMTAFAHFNFVSFLYDQDESVVKTSSFTATILDEYRINGDVIRGFMEDEDGQKIYFIYQFPSAGEKGLWESTSLTGIVMQVEGAWQEQQESSHRYAFNMDTYLMSKGAVGPFEIAHFSIVGNKTSLQSILAKQRFKLASHIDEHFPGNLAQEAKALLIGIQDGLDSDLERAYQKLGITHLFAISGLHVALLSFLFYECLLRLHVRTEVATILLLLILPLYAFLAGGAPSIWRAVMVVEIIGVMKLCNKKVPIDDALSICCILFLTLSPHSLFQVGFQLSYMATYSLIYSSRILFSSANLFVQNFFMTLVCQLLTYPLLIFHFYELSLSSFLANIVFVPLFSFIIVPINLVLVVLSYVSKSLTELFISVYEPIRMLLTDFLLVLKDLPYQMWVPGKPSLLWLIILYATVFIALYFIDCKRWGGAVVVLIIPALLFTSRFLLNNELQVTFINVGQGDSILIESPRRKHVVLIDSGGLLRFQKDEWKTRDAPYEVGRQVVVPYLKGKGIATINTMILTHADADHVEGAEEIAKEIRIKEIHVSPNSWAEKAMDEMRIEAEKQSIPIIEQIAGRGWHIGQTAFAYLSPTDMQYEGNNDSLVLYVQHGDFRALFTGDLEKDGEYTLIRHYGPSIRHVSLLKAGHHGSKTSSSEEFVEYMMPALTIFTAGKDNRYNHPAQEVVERFEERGLRYYTTGTDGTIEISINEKGSITSLLAWGLRK